MDMVTWVLTNGSYEVSSKEHLLQIMHNGSLFQNTGSVPPNYRNVSFLQTANIDLESDIANIRVITVFRGIYDGQEFSVSNWRCTALSGKGTAFFGHTQNAIVRNMVLKGVWKTLGTIDGAFFAGHNTGSQFYNITADFAPGTEITATSDSLGGLFSYTGGCTLQNITLGGTIDKFEGSAYTGGVVGFSGYSGGSTFSYIRNIAIFTTGIVTTAQAAGGIFGHFGQGDTISHVVNAMRGSIQGPPKTGGITGVVNGATMNYVCNSMIGDVIGSNSSAIAAVVTGGGTSTHIVNYMTGDVKSGFMGTVASTNFSSCIVAMTGATTHAAFASGHGSSQVLLDDSYGITYTSSLGTVAAMDTSTFETHPSFDLPYWSLSLVDTASNNSIEWPFVFGNVGTTTDHDWMVTVGSGTDVLFVGTETLNATVAPDTGATLTPRPLGLGVSFEAVADAVAYMLTVRRAGGQAVRTVARGFTELTLDINSLLPETDYTVRLYVTTDGAEYALHSETTVTTLANTGPNYNASDFARQDGTAAFDLVDLHTDSVKYLFKVMNEVFTTGDDVLVTLPGGSRKKTRFINRGESASIVNVEAVLLPFEADAGASQSASLTLSDNSSVTITFDETSETVDVGGTVCSTGDSVLIDGKKMTVTSI